jgi:hypothetical protein
MRRAAGIVVLSALALASAAGRGDDGHAATPADPGAGLLEFLGSVDRLAELNPNYLPPADPARAGETGPKGGVKTAQSPPQPLGPSAPGGKNNE